MIAGRLLVQLRGHRLVRRGVKAAGVPGREGPGRAVVAGTRGRVAADEAAVAGDPGALGGARGGAHHRVVLAVGVRRLPNVLDSGRGHDRRVTVLVGLFLLLALLSGAARVRGGCVTTRLRGGRVKFTGRGDARVVRRVLGRSRVRAATRVNAQRGRRVMMVLTGCVG